DMSGMGMGGMGMGVSPGSMSVKSVAFPNLGTASGASNTPNLNLLMDVQMSVTVELGRTKMYIKDILGLGEGSIIELDKLAGEPVDLLVNGKLIAKGEVVVIDENFGVRVTDIVSPIDRIKPEGK
ncbi:flagellar motor switch protein FliN, partial [Leptospira santarosai]